MDRKPGGARKGSGRKKGSSPQRTKKSTLAKAKQLAKETGELPHEFLARVARGETIEMNRSVTTYYKSGPKKGEEKSTVVEKYKYTPNYQERVDAAKAAAPFYAPKLATQTVKSDGETAQAIVEAFHALADRLPV